MDFGNRIFSLNHFATSFETIDSKRNIELQLYEAPKTDKFYLKQKKQIIQDFLKQLNKFEQTTAWKPNSQDSMYLIYNHFEKILSITINYFLKEGDRYISGVIQHNFRGDNKAPIYLADVFDSQFDYQTFLTAKIYDYLSSFNLSISSDVIYSQLDAIAMELQGKGILLHLAQLNDISAKQIDPLFVQFQEIGIDHLSPYLRQAPKEK